ncbi:MAG: hypothetical protein WCL32_14405, partial [Planctomycetota bacterium]
MKPVQYAMNHRSRDDACRRDQNQTAIKRITTGEELTAPGMQFAQGPHAGENHGGVHEGIDSRHLFKMPVALVISIQKENTIGIEKENAV